jgi:hypothetical protein
LLGLEGIFVRVDVDEFVLRLSWIYEELTLRFDHVSLLLVPCMKFIRVTMRECLSRLMRSVLCGNNSVS